MQEIVATSTAAAAEAEAPMLLLLMLKLLLPNLGPDRGSRGFGSRGSASSDTIRCIQALIYLISEVKEDGFCTCGECFRYQVHCCAMEVDCANPNLFVPPSAAPPPPCRLSAKLAVDSTRAGWPRSPLIETACENLQ